MRTYAKTWPDRVWAVEGSNGAGRPLAQRLLEAGEHVVDIPGQDQLCLPDSRIGESYFAPVVELVRERGSRSPHLSWVTAVRKR